VGLRSEGHEFESLTEILRAFPRSLQGSDDSFLPHSNQRSVVRYGPARRAVAPTARTVKGAPASCGMSNAFWLSALTAAQAPATVQEIGPNLRPKLQGGWGAGVWQRVPALLPTGEVTQG
jgi:hypothetical protein